ncbi:15085_t:CDS:1, partial [Gigaspora rosea]
SQLLDFTARKWFQGFEIEQFHGFVIGVVLRLRKSVPSWLRRFSASLL